MIDPNDPFEPVKRFWADEERVRLKAQIAFVWGLTLGMVITALVALVVRHYHL